MAHPLEVSYNWRTPTLFASLGAVVCLGVLIRGRVPGWVSVALIIVGLWAVFITLVYLRTRALLMVDGDQLTLRRYRTLHTFRGADVVAMSQIHTPNGPSYRLTVRGPDGRTQRLIAPVALLRRGHPTPLRMDTGPRAPRRAGHRLAQDPLPAPGTRARAVSPVKSGWLGTDVVGYCVEQAALSCRTQPCWR